MRPQRTAQLCTRSRGPSQNGPLASHLLHVPLRKLGKALTKAEGCKGNRSSSCFQPTQPRSQKRKGDRSLKLQQLDERETRRQGEPSSRGAPRHQTRGSKRLSTSAWPWKSWVGQKGQRSPAPVCAGSVRRGARPDVTGGEILSWQGAALSTDGAPEPTDTRYEDDEQEREEVARRIERKVEGIELPSGDKRLVDLVKEGARGTGGERDQETAAWPLPATGPVASLRPERRCSEQEEALEKELRNVGPPSDVRDREQRAGGSPRLLRGSRRTPRWRQIEPCPPS